MENNFNFINYFETPTILQKTSLLNDSDWVIGKARTKNCDSYVKTKSIVARGNKWIDCHPDYLAKNEKRFETELINLHNFFLHIYKKGQLTNFIIVKLLPHSTISEHKNDNLENGSKRYLIPILSDPEIQYEIGGEEKNICANEVWEIDCEKSFAVKNYSANLCMYLKVDWSL